MPLIHFKHHLTAHFDDASSITVDDDTPLTLDDLQRQVLLQQIAAVRTGESRSASATGLPGASRRGRPSASSRRTPAAPERNSGDLAERRPHPAHLWAARPPGADGAVSKNAARQSARGGDKRAQRRAGATKRSATNRNQRRATRPGTYTLTLGTPACRMVIRFEPGGVRIESLDVGMELVLRPRLA